ncbi:MAG: malto-oligosyltrehalose synthase, partial [Alphaproteobacteria bacterium]
RGEDVRARLAVLSEIAGEWRTAARPLLARRPAALAGGDALMLPQTLVGAWPLDGGPDALAGFAGRVAAWQLKALREAKHATDWTVPDESYERMARSYLDFLLDDAASRETLAGIVQRIAPAGAVNGLAQLLLRLTVPGVPDTYQGTERWDLSLVDPDNRRPVDFAARAAVLAEEPPIAALARAWRDGRIKQAVLARTLAFRADRPRLFAEGGYQPIAIAGPRADRLVAFLRRLDDVAVAVVVPYRAAALLDGGGGIVIDRAAWSDTRLVLPRCRAMAEVVTGRALDGAASGRLAVASALADLPVALVALEGLA